MAEEPIDKNLFFSHVECDYFPCHEGVALERFNCLLCYCPLYALGPACGGNFTYTKKGYKNCVQCTIPHDGDSGVKLVKERFRELAVLAAAGTEAAGAAGAAEAAETAGAAGASGVAEAAELTAAGETSPE